MTNHEKALEEIERERCKETGKRVSCKLEFFMWRPCERIFFNTPHKTLHTISCPTLHSLPMANGWWSFTTSLYKTIINYLSNIRTNGLTWMKTFGLYLWASKKMPCGRLNDGFLLLHKGVRISTRIPACFPEFHPNHLK